MLLGALPPTHTNLLGSSRCLELSLSGSPSRVGCLFLSQTFKVSRTNKRLVRGGGSVMAAETPGAYQLIDDGSGLSYRETADSVHHAMIEHVDGEDGGTKILSENNSIDSTVARRSFGRLKVQNVKPFVKNHSRLNSECKEDNDDPIINHLLSNKSVAAHSKLEYMGKKKKRYSRAPEFQEFRESKQRKGTGEERNHPHLYSKYSSKTLSESGIAPHKHRKSDPNLFKQDVPIYGGSAAYLRGWGNGGSTQSSNSESTDLQKQRWKFSSENEFFSCKSFKDMGCNEYIIQYLVGQHFPRPSHIQAKAFAPVTEGKSCIIADQSGSGKTLAYLVPVIQCLRQEELEGLYKSSTQSPRVVIIVPTAELASQVLTNCRSMSKFGIPFRSMAVTGGFRQRTQLENLQEGVDVLIATPGRLMILIKEGFLQLSCLRCVVLDEVDVLFSDEGFEAALQNLINSSAITTQYLFVTATLPVDIYNKLVEHFPDCEVIMGPGMHRISSGLEEVLVDCTGDVEGEKTPDTAFSNKKDALLQLAERSPVSKTIVFCNKIETCRKVENVLKRFDKTGTRVQVLTFHAALAQASRLVNMQEFTTSRCDQISQFFICTDRASRGIDFANVNHVVLFDFPRDPSEYVRRVGRTARGAGGKGKAFIFVVGKQVFLARKILERSRKGHPLHDVPSTYELKN